MKLILCSINNNVTFTRGGDKMDGLSSRLRSYKNGIPKRFIRYSVKTEFLFVFK